MELVDRVAQIEVLRGAWRRVQANGGAPGIDRITVADFAADLEGNLGRLSSELEARAYRPLAVVRLRPLFLAQSDRPLVVLTVRDRVVQRALADALTPLVESTLSPACWAYRKGRSATSAAEQVGQWVGDYPWALRCDVERFFESTDLEMLQERLAKFVDAPSIRFLKRVIRARAPGLDGALEPVAGISQGSPLSPVLANLYLNDLDHQVSEHHPRYIRYCDDLIVLESDEDAVQTAKRVIDAALDRVSLRLNERKTLICRVEDGFTFLGYHFDATGRGPAVKAVAALHHRLGEMVEDQNLDPGATDGLFRGWTAYYGGGPEPWLEQPLGILALLRNRGQFPWDDTFAERLRAARWRAEADLPPQTSLLLAKAWVDAGLEENAWLELATGSMSRDDTVLFGEWSQLLGSSIERIAAVRSEKESHPERRLARLCEMLAADGHYEVARRLAGVGAEALTPTVSGEPAPADLAEIADLPLLLEWFQGADGVHCVERLTRGGHRKFLPDHRPLAEGDWLDHLKGERTLALPLLRADDTVLLAVLDVDITRREVDERFGITDDLLGRALGAALKLQSTLHARGVESLLEFSGHKGYHLWLRCSAPIPAARLRRFLNGIVATAGPLPEGIRVEVLPGRDRLRGISPGPVVKLPLGVHSKTGRRCLLVDRRGRPLDDPFEAIRTLPRFAPSLAEVDSSAEAPPQLEPLNSRFGSRVRQIIDGCGVIRLLVEKSRTTLYLNHGERTLLLCTLGHLGQEGSDALHAVIGCTYNYNRDTTERHIGKLLPNPISCARIRELHPETSARAGCSCSFALRGRGYPTPLLFALRASEILVFRRRVPRTPREEAPPADKRDGRLREDEADSVEVLLARIGELHRHRRGIERSIARSLRSLEEHFARAESDEIEVKMGLLKRVRRQDGGWDYVIEI